MSDDHLTLREAGLRILRDCPETAALLWTIPGPGWLVCFPGGEDRQWYALDEWSLGTELCGDPTCDAARLCSPRSAYRWLPVSEVAIVRLAEARGSFSCHSAVFDDYPREAALWALLRTTSDQPPEREVPS